MFVLLQFVLYGVICRNLREDTGEVSYGILEPLELHDEVLRYNPEAFECNSAGTQSI